MVKVCCCWDDGVANDIRLIEIIRKYHAKATFNLNPGSMGEYTRPSLWTDFRECKGFNGFVNGRIGRSEMKEIYQDFQVASHGWVHKCAGVVPDEEFIKDAVDAKYFLEDAFQRPCLGYAWAGGTFTASAGELLRKAGFLYARTTQYTDNQAEIAANPMELRSACHYQSRDFYRHFLKAKVDNGIFYFWGHSYEMMDCEGLWRQTEDKFAMLADDPEVEWIDVIDIVKNK